MLHIFCRIIFLALIMPLEYRKTYADLQTEHENFCNWWLFQSFAVSIRELPQERENVKKGTR